MNLTRIKAVISTLNCIEVKGKDNLDRLLGCIQTLESVAMELQMGETKKAFEEVTDG
jgi:hypothetical protein